MQNRLINLLGSEVVTTVTSSSAVPLYWPPTLDSGYEVRVEEGQGKGQTHSLDSAFLMLGRGDSKIEARPGWVLFPEPSISRRQAFVAWDASSETYHLSHIPGATNATLVDGRPVPEARLRVGSYVKMGLLGFRIRKRTCHSPRRVDGFVGQVLTHLGLPRNPATPVHTSGFALTIHSGLSRGCSHMLTKSYYVLGRGLHHGVEDAEGAIWFKDGSLMDQQAVLVWSDRDRTYVLVPNPQATVPVQLESGAWDLIAPQTRTPHTVTEATYLQPGDLITIGTLGIEVHTDMPELLSQATLIGQGGSSHLGAPLTSAAPVSNTQRIRPSLLDEDRKSHRAREGIEAGAPPAGPRPGLAVPISGAMASASARAFLHSKDAPSPSQTLEGVLSVADADDASSLQSEVLSLDELTLHPLYSVKTVRTDDALDPPANEGSGEIGVTPELPPESTSPPAFVESLEEPALEAPLVSEFQVAELPTEEDVPLPAEAQPLVEPPAPSAPPRANAAKPPSSAAPLPETEAQPAAMSSSTDGSPQTWNVGDKLMGRYEILGVATGGMATVYFTYDTQWKVPFAIKGLRPELAAQSDARDRFYREALVWVKLGTHPFIVTAEMAQVVDNQPWLFLEYLDGGDLASVLSEGPIPLEKTLLWSTQFSLGVGHAYSTSGLVHRDIKPSNALLTVEGDVKVTDFGISRTVQDSGGRDVFATREGVISGTLAYMSPEGYERPEEVDTRSDIYSFGCMLYELLTGMQLFSGKTLPDQILARYSGQIDTDKLPALQTVPRPVVAILQKCLRFAPDERFNTFDELSMALQQAYEEVLGRPFTMPVVRTEDSANAYHNRGISLANLGFHQDAIEWFQKALAIYPEMSDTRVALGDSMLAAGYAEDAVQVYTQAVVADPADARSRLGLAHAKEACNDNDGALSYYRSVVENPQFGWQACFMGAALLDRLGQTEEAAQWRSMVPDHRQTQGGTAVSSVDFRAGSRGLVRLRTVQRIMVRRARFTTDAFVVEVRGEDVPVPWSQVTLVQVGSVRDEGPGGVWHYLMDVLTPGQLFRFDSRNIGYLAFLGKDMAKNESMNLVRIMQRFYELAPRCRFSPSKRELAQAGSLAISRYQSVKNFDAHGSRLLRMPRRA